MLAIHDRIFKAITERNAEKAIRELEHHFDIQIEHLYNQNDENSHEHQVKPTLIAEDKGGDRGNIR
jgi:DNA-binding GntR family transcriptional regulator